jgi:hypothetical protein
MQRNDVGLVDELQGVGDQGALIKGFFNLHGLRPAGFIRRRTMVTYQDTEKYQPKNPRHAARFHFTSLRKSATDQHTLNVTYQPE